VKRQDICIGVDLGGTKTEIVALGGDGEVLIRERRPTPRDDYEATVFTIVGLVHDAEQDLGVECTVGVCIPGAISNRSGTVKNANSTWLNGQPLDRDLAAALSRPIRCENDANCFALSEATDGAASGSRFVFAAILGTGCGAGIAVDGRVHRGPNSVAGEWGHNQLAWRTPEDSLSELCYCGREHCLEMYVSGTGLERDYAALTTGDSAVNIVQHADGGDELALGVLDRYEDRLARGLAAVVNTVDPDVIVLGGGMSNIERLYESVPDHMAKYVIGGECETKVVAAEHGDSSGVRGAAWLWSHEPG
jgi:fructokinase